MPKGSSTILSEYYKVPFDDLVKRLYCDQGFSAEEIAGKFREDTGVVVTSRLIHLRTKALGISRTKAEARLLAIERGRVSYEHLRKPIKSKELRKGISLPVRYSILKRDGFRCTLCGTKPEPQNGIHLIVDHIIPVVRGGTRDIKNLRTLCSACNHGKMIYENEK